MSRSDLDRLRDARNFVQYALHNAGGLSANALAETVQRQHAALYDLAVIGETLNKVSSEIKSAASDLPRRAMTSLRNLIIHAYWQIDLANIARIVEAELEPLMKGLEKLITFVEGSEK
jgi:uncharacterized protein with HEPN domain